MKRIQKKPIEILSYIISGMREGSQPSDLQSETSDMRMRPRPTLRLCEATRFIAFGNFWR